MGAQPEEVTPEQIRERMADTRAALAGRIDRLRAEASPKALIGRQLTGARRKLRGTKERAAPLAEATSEKAGKLGDLGERVPSSVRGATGTLRGQLDQRPMLAGVAALLLGAAAAMALPGPHRR